MILDRLDPTVEELARETGWHVKPEGACKAHLCVPLPEAARTAPGRIDVRVLAERLGMALVEDPARGRFALGPESGGRALSSAELPEITLPDRNGRDFSLRSLGGTKVFMCAWASW
jgi:hypothetical protein